MAQKKTSELPNDSKELHAMLVTLKKDLHDQVRSIKTGTATNVRVARKTRKQIARVKTKLQSINTQEGERSKS